jgi:hypothetical protein
VDKLELTGFELISLRRIRLAAAAGAAMGVQGSIPACLLVWCDLQAHVYEPLLG